MLTSVRDGFVLFPILLIGVFIQRILIIFCHQIFIVELVHEFYLYLLFGPIVVGWCIFDMDFRFLISRNISCCSSHISIFHIKFATRYSITYNHQWQNSTWWSPLLHQKLGFYMTVPVIATVRFIIPQGQKRSPDQERISRSKIYEG